ncbi:Secoisolariciresinol dehydrogenase [Capsicum baccatum]|uniref:Secoisolariciresinol dehydrogenase n=1 Tax=Capsicum baccatum TaxID=33114 RepID=A0A2G2VU37_CAPBA|nr:Secoisolariciresinol dehydrogenase [Capsicum baccatum]
MGIPSSVTPIIKRSSLVQRTRLKRHISFAHCDVTHENDMQNAIEGEISIGLTNHLAVELGQYGIRANCISPYIVATPLVREILGKIDQEKAEEIIMETANLKGTILELEDTDEAAVYLGSDES